MENIRGKGIGAEDSVFEELVPCSAWTEDSSCHYLLVDLPGFKKEELKLQVDEHGYVLVSGERQMNTNKIVHFKEKVKVPKNSDMEKISGKYEGEILYVVVRKRVRDVEEKKHDTVADNIIDEMHKEEEEKPNKVTTNIVNGMYDHKETKNGKNTQKEVLREQLMSESGLLGSATEMVSNNKAIVVTALLAFSLGVLLSQKFQSCGDFD